MNPVEMTSVTGVKFKFKSCHAEYFNVLHSSSIFIHLLCSILVACMHFQLDWKKVGILIRLLFKKLADLDLQCFFFKKG